MYGVHICSCVQLRECPVEVANDVEYKLVSLYIPVCQ